MRIPILIVLIKIYLLQENKVSFLKVFFNGQARYFSVKLGLSHTFYKILVGFEMVDSIALVYWEGRRLFFLFD